MQKCKQIIDYSTGPINITFEFTEWPHKIDFDHYTKKELSRFFMCNSSHVVDTVFHLAGYPRDLKAMTYGHLDWHPSAAIFSGCGVTNKNILFSYSANWLSAGRWGIDINTDKGKYILKPLETPLDLNFRLSILSPHCHLSLAQPPFQILSILIKTLQLKFLK